jgi:hypothetical protein
METMNNKWKKTIFAITLTTAIVIIIVLLLKCCSGDKQKELINISDTLGIKKDSSAISNRLSCIDSIPLQQFIIEGGRHQIITGLKGCSFLFPANCFVDEKDLLVNGKVVIELREVNGIEDFIKSGITTLSDGKLLASDGCFYLNAKQNNKNLKLKSNYSVYSSLPHSRKIDGMQFFKGDAESNDINWKLVENKKELNPDEVPKLPEKEKIKLSDEEINKSAERNRIGNSILEMRILQERMKNYLADNINNNDVKYTKQSIEVEDGVKKEYYMPEIYISNKELLQKHKYTCFNDELFRIYLNFKKKPDTVYYKKNEAFNISLEGKRKKEQEKKDFRYYTADSVHIRLKKLSEINSIIEKKTQQLREINDKLSEVNWYLAWQTFIGSQTNNFDNLSIEKIGEKIEAEKKNRKESPYLYSLIDIGQWFNCDKFYQLNMQFQTFSGKSDFEGAVVHLVSTKEQIHLQSIVSNQAFSFSYPENLPFKIIIQKQGQKEIIKEFDGLSPNLGKL